MPTHALPIPTGLLRHHAPRRLLSLSSLVLGVIVLIDRLTWGMLPGFGVAIALVITTAVLGSRFPFLRGTWPGRVALGWLLLLSAALALDAGPLVLAMGLLATATAGVMGRSADADPARVVIRLMRGWCIASVRPILDQALVARALLRWPHARSWRWWRQAAYWVVPLGVGGIFAVLFLAANPVIQHALDALGTWLGSWGERIGAPHPIRVLLWWVIGWTGWCVLRSRWPGVAAPIVRVTTDRRALVRRTLLVCNLVFLGQNLLDLAYLWGGAALPDHLTYAEYAHRGAYPLLITTLLAGGFILAWFRPGAATERDPWCRRLVALWTGQNVWLLAASLWRLHLYVDAYGLSQWRIAAAIWMLLVAVGLALVAWRIIARRDHHWLLGWNLRCGAGVLTVCCLIDWSSLIAWHNVRHARECGGDGVAVDLGYLGSLGAPALPALTWYAAHATDQDAQAVQAVIVASVREMLDRNDDWRSRTWRSVVLAEQHRTTTTAAQPELP